MSAKGKIVNTTTGFRYCRILWSRGTFSAGRNAEKRAARANINKRMPMLADRRVRQMRGSL